MIKKIENTKNGFFGRVYFTFLESIGQHTYKPYLTLFLVTLFFSGIIKKEIYIREDR